MTGLKRSRQLEDVKFPSAVDVCGVREEDSQGALRNKKAFSSNRARRTPDRNSDNLCRNGFLLLPGEDHRGDCSRDQQLNRVKTEPLD